MTDSTSIPPIYTPATLRSPRRPLVIAILACLGLLLTGSGVFAIYLSFCADAPLAVRLFPFVAGAFCLFLPGSFAFVGIRRKLTTGRWTLTPEERVEHFLKIAAKTPSRTSRVISSPGFNLALNLTMLMIAGFMIWPAFRSGFHAWDDVMAVFWIGLAAQAVWQIARRRLKPVSLT